MINGLHAIVFSPEAEKVQAFLRDVLGLSSVDAGGGWPIFAAPPAEIAVHPSDGDRRHELYLMCDDIDATLAELADALAIRTGHLEPGRYSLTIDGKKVSVPEGSTVMAACTALAFNS